MPVPFVEKLWIVPDVFWLATVPPVTDKSPVCCLRGLGSPAVAHLLDGELVDLFVGESSTVIPNETEGESSNVSIIIPVDAE